MLATPLCLYWCSSCCFNNLFLPPSHSFLLLLQIQGRVGISGVIFPKRITRLLIFSLWEVFFVVCFVHSFALRPAALWLFGWWCWWLEILTSYRPFFCHSLQSDTQAEREPRFAPPRGSTKADVGFGGISLNFRIENFAPEWWAQGAGSLTSASMNRLQPGPALGIDEESDYWFAY